MVGRTNAGGSGGVKGMPQFTYTGTYSLIDDGDKNWRIKFLTSGTLKFTKLGTGNGYVDLFAVGGGGGSGHYNVENYHFYAGGGSGYCETLLGAIISKNTDIAITIGNGASSGSMLAGGNSSFGTLLTANGGGGAYRNGYIYGGNGQGGGAGSDAGNGGVNGGNGTGSYIMYGGSQPGYGRGLTSREFGEATGDLYATGGGANISFVNNTGNGSRISPNVSFAGASGIVIIRSHRSA